MWVNDWTVRHPVGTGLPRWRADGQDVPPCGWCVCCGGEIFVPGRTVCAWCEDGRSDYPGQGETL